MTDDLPTLYRARFGTEPPELAELPALAPLLGRRSVRRFRDEPVPEPLLRTVLACAQSAPAKSDLQQYSILRIRAKRAPFLALVESQDWLRAAPELLLFCGDMRRGQRVAELRGRRHDSNTMDGFLNAGVDAALALAYTLAAAETVGLGGCPVSLVRNRIDEMAALCELPPGVFPVAGLGLGWPAGGGITSVRLPPAVVLHEDRYDDSRLPAELDAYDQRRPPLPPEKQLHRDRYGDEPDCRWSHQTARRLSVRERARFREFLLQNGFELG